MALRIAKFHVRPVASLIPSKEIIMIGFSEAGPTTNASDLVTAASATPEVGGYLERSE